MGNSNGLIASLLSEGNNDIIHINKNDYFSFAFGNEIALVINDSYYILNCDNKLWKRTKTKVKLTKNKHELKTWWHKQSKKYEISDWSNNFEDLK